MSFPSSPEFALPFDTRNKVHRVDGAYKAPSDWVPPWRPLQAAHLSLLLPCALTAVAQHTSFCNSSPPSSLWSPADALRSCSMPGSHHSKSLLLSPRPTPSPLTSGIPICLSNRRFKSLQGGRIHLFCTHAEIHSHLQQITLL